MKWSVLRVICLRNMSFTPAVSKNQIWERLCVVVWFHETSIEDNSGSPPTLHFNHFLQHDLRKKKNTDFSRRHVHSLHVLVPLDSGSWYVTLAPGNSAGSSSSSHRISTSPRGMSIGSMFTCFCWTYERAALSGSSRDSQYPHDCLSVDCTLRFM